MTDIAIHVDKLSKKYKLGAMYERQDTLRDFLVSMVNSPFRKKPVSDNQILWALKDISFDIHARRTVAVAMSGPIPAAPSGPTTRPSGRCIRAGGRATGGRERGFTSGRRPTGVRILSDPGQGRRPGDGC